MLQRIESFLGARDVTVDVPDWESVVPPRTREAMKPHQREAVDFFYAKNGRALVSLPPGAGKTLIGCAVAKFSGGVPNQSLIIVPANKVKDWERDYVKWMATSELGEDRPLVISYDKVRNDKRVLSGHWRCVVLDESHMIKDVSAKRTQAIMPLVLRTRYVLFLTGTPVLNHHGELFPMLNGILPHVVSRVWDFNELFCTFSEFIVRGRSVKKISGSQNGELLNRLLDRVQYRNLDVVTTSVPFSRKTVDLDVEEGGELGLEVTFDKQKFFAMAEHGGDSTDVMLAANKLNAKCGLLKAHLSVPFIRRLLMTKGGVVVFTKHLEPIEVLKGYFPEALVATGATSAEERDRVVSTMASGRGRLLITTIRCLGVGVTLCPGVTRVVFVEREFTPSLNDQAECRAYRMGASESVTSYHMRLKGGWDDVVERKLQRKASDAAQAVDGGQVKRIRT